MPKKAGLFFPPFLLAGKAHHAGRRLVHKPYLLAGHAPPYGKVHHFFFASWIAALTFMRDARTDILSFRSSFPGRFCSSSIAIFGSVWSSIRNRIVLSCRFGFLSTSSRSLSYSFRR